MVTTSTIPAGAQTGQRTAPSLSLLAEDCSWDEQLRRAGIEPEPSAALDRGVPALALLTLLLAGLAAVLAPDAGGKIGPGAVALLAAASLPWLWWLRRGDDGPSWVFAVIAMAPVTLLGVGQWFNDALSLGSMMAYVVLAFPSLFLIVLAIGAAQPRMATMISVVAYAGFAGPLVAAWLADREIDGVAVAAWHVTVLLAAVAGYAVRFSYHANLPVTAAREALAWQAAEEERHQIARDVHEVVAHTMAVTMLHVTGARMAVQRGAQAEAVAALEEAERQGRASLADIRRIVRLLRADDRDAIDTASPGLPEIDALVEGYRAAGLEIGFERHLAGARLAPSTELALYRVLQEALANAVRHGAGAAGIVLRGDQTGVSVQITNPTSRGSGLIGMRERIAAAGGTFEAGPRNGRWVVDATIPAEAGA
jgi:signal transduction histidine kinase